MNSAHTSPLSFDHQAGHFLRQGRPIEFTSEEFERLTSLRWWHEIPFAPGVATQAHHAPYRMNLPRLFHIHDFDFRGKEVLDIGSADGFYSFWAEAHGAARVVALDDLSQLRVGRTKIDFARSKLGSTIELVNMSVYDLLPKTLGGFDTVMMFGVLYHLVHPMLGIEKACGVCKSDLFLETFYIKTEIDTPLCVLFPNDECHKDYTNWSGPNLPWLVHALEIQGFKAQQITEVSNERIAIHAVRVRNRHTESDVLNPHRDTTFFHLGAKES